MRKAWLAVVGVALVAGSGCGDARKPHEPPQAYPGETVAIQSEHDFATIYHDGRRQIGTVPSQTKARFVGKGEGAYSRVVPLDGEFKGVECEVGNRHIATGFSLWRHFDTILLWTAAAVVAGVFWERCRATGGNPWFGERQSRSLRIK